MKLGADALIVGGGVVGCAVARELAGRGLSVVLLERAQIGGESSGAAAGLLSPQAEASAPGPLFEAGLASRRMYADWVAALEAESGRDVGYRTTGILRCAVTDAEDRRLAAAATWQRGAGLPVEILTAAAAERAAGAAIHPDVRRYFFFPDEGVVHCPALMAALERSLAARGVAVETHTPVSRLRMAGGVCRGVDTPAGPVEAKVVVLATGAWTGQEPALPLALPVRPVRGQIAALLPERDLATVVQSEEVYAVPRSDGALLVGATAEEVGFDKSVTREGVDGLLIAARRLLPSLARARVDSAWAGLRPGTPDGLPFLGETGLTGLYVAAGHFRSGILLAPWTARVLADQITGVSRGAPPAFSPARLPAAGEPPVSEALGQGSLLALAGEATFFG